MKAFSLIAASTLVSLVSASPSDNLSKRSGSSIAITGVPGDTQPRLEVRQLASEQPEQWSLFILALQQWEAGDTSSTSGYYQISGIHGVPRVSWDGVEPCDGCGDSDGYCTHDSVLFPAWHRAYVALLEQELIAVAQEVADSYPDSTRASMQAAASALRLPYWDWAAQPGSGHVLPESVSGQQITVNGPNGQQTIANPLYSYKFSDPSELVYSPFTTWSDTLRYPSSDAVSAASQENQATNAFDNIRPSLQDQVYQLMSTCTDYLQFSNDASGSSSSSCSSSLEAIHNTVHGVAGGPPSSSATGGHMSYLPLAAFDPLFWLHHANVDRLFALWQGIHPDSFGASQTAPHTTWTIQQGSTQGADSPLMPFSKNTAGDFWTTNDVRDWESTFHYTYPEFVSTDGSEGAIASVVNDLYGPKATLTAGGVPATVKTKVASSSTTESPSSSTSSPASVTVSSSSTSSSASVTVSSSSSTVSSSSAYVSTTSTYASTAKSNSSAPAHTETASASSHHGGLDLPTISLPSIAIPTISLPSIAIPTFTPPWTNWTLPIPYVTPDNGSEYQYVANCQSERYALGGSYYILLFNGQPSDEPSTWFGADNLIGLLSIVAGGNMKVNLVSTGAIPLTRSLQNLVSQGVLSDMSEDSCLPYLKEHLVWKILGPDGEAIEPTTVPSFEVSVYSSTSTISGQFSLPKWSDFIPQVGVTSHKAGGANSSDTGIGGGSGIGSGVSLPPSGHGGKKTVTVVKTSTTTYCPCAATATPW